MRIFEEIEAHIDQGMINGDAMELLRFAAELDEDQAPIAQASACRARGCAYAFRGDYPTAFEQLRRALALYKEFDDRIGVARVTSNIGIVLMNTGDYPAALEHFYRALALAEELGDRRSAARVTGNIGIVLNLTGDYPVALEHYHRALSIQEELGDRIGLAHVLDCIGTVHFNTGGYTSALEYYHSALALYEELGDRRSVASVTGNIGNVHFYTGSAPKALEYNYRALAVHEELGNRSGVAHVTGNLLALHLKMEANDGAQAILLTMDAMQIDDPRVRINREINRAALQEHSGDLDDAAATLQRALAEALEHGLRDETADAHLNLRDLALEQNNLAGYVEHNNEYTRITEEINGKETATKLATHVAERKLAKERNEHEKHLAVLHSTLPKHIADRVARGETVTDQFDNAAVMFVDIVGFTTLSSTLTSQQVTTLLDAVFEICDEACNANRVTRIKTIGDSYMAVAFGEIANSEITNSEIANSEIANSEQRVASANHRIANVALQIIEHITATDFESLQSLQVPSISSSDSKRLQVPSISSSDSKRLQVPSISSSDSKRLQVPSMSSSDSEQLQVRVGIHCGPITAGVLGKERLQYDVWGDTVNVASRMESTSEPGRIQVSEQFARSLRDVPSSTFQVPSSTTNLQRHEGVNDIPTKEGIDSASGNWHLAFRGATEIKGKGEMQTFWLSRNA